jgi:hypothetical protein
MAYLYRSKGSVGTTVAVLFLYVPYIHTYFREIALRGTCTYICMVSINGSTKDSARAVCSCNLNLTLNLKRSVLRRYSTNTGREGCLVVPANNERAVTVTTVHHFTVRKPSPFHCPYSSSPTVTVSTDRSVRPLRPSALHPYLLSNKRSAVLLASQAPPPPNIRKCFM